MRIKSWLKDFGPLSSEIAVFNMQVSNGINVENAVQTASDGNETELEPLGDYYRRKYGPRELLYSSVKRAMKDGMSSYVVGSAWEDVDFDIMDAVADHDPLYTCKTYEQKKCGGLCEKYVFCRSPQTHKWIDFAETQKLKWTVMRTASNYGNDTYYDSKALFVLSWSS